MDIIFLIGIVQALFLSVLIFSKKQKSTGDFVLGIWMVFLGLHLLDTYINSTGIVLKYPHLLAIGFNFPMLQGPFMFVYVLVMINKKGRFKPVYLLHSLPFLVFTVYLISDFYCLSASEKLSYYEIQAEQFSPAIRLMQFFKILLGPFYVVWSLIKLKTHRKNILEYFSYSERINLNWLQFVIAGLGFVWVTVLISVILEIALPMSDYPIYISVTVVIFFLGYFGLKQQVIYDNRLQNFEKLEDDKEVKIEELAEDKPKGRYKKSGLDENTAKEYLNMLLSYMAKEKPYLNGKLSLKEVADYLGISINHLSQVINEQTGMSFFDFINKYRVDEVKMRLADPKYEQFTLLGIAYDCGFNSKSSFNSIFKKATGLTPSQFSKINLN
ncbi:MAG: AraC family transcriptional regulator [Bacteroidales bacterium]|nr:MAG: AraC family transcriptional regulator [Bacteroidales bacterium]